MESMDDPECGGRGRGRRKRRGKGSERGQGDTFPAVPSRASAATPLHSPPPFQCPGPSFFAGFELSIGVPPKGPPPLYLKYAFSNLASCVLYSDTRWPALPFLLKLPEWTPGARVDVGAQ